MPFPWGAAIAAGGSILGGLLGGGNKGPSFGDQKSWMREQMMSRIKWTVDDARRSGIHPLVALGAGAFSASPAPVDGQSAWGNSIGDAAAALGGGLDAAFAQDADLEEAERMRMDRIAADVVNQGREDAAIAAQAKRDALQEKLINAQIMESQSRTALDMARARAVGGMSSGSPSVLTDAFGRRWDVSGQVPAQEFENQFGEPGDWYFGGGNLLQSFARENVRKQAGERGRDAGMAAGSEAGRQIGIILNRGW